MRNGRTKETDGRVGARGLPWPCAALFLSLLLASACHSTPSARPYARPYPDLKQSEVLNIQVVRQAKAIQFTNTTARAFGPSTVWVNARFCQPIDGLGIGESKTLRMKDFRDEFQDTFRGGGFFAVEPPSGWLWPRSKRRTRMGNR